MDWYAEWFGTDYLELYPHRDEAEAQRQLNFLVAALPRLAPGMRVLDLCCGAGRHTSLLTERGFRVVGIDLSAALLARATDGDSRLQLIRGDMRRLPFGPVFHLVANFFTSFGYFATNSENRSILTAIASVLRPEGRFLIDYLNPDQVRASLVPESISRLADGSEVCQRRRVNEETCRVEKDILITGPDGDQRRFRESVRLYTRGEMATMIDRSGLCLDTVYGDFIEGETHDGTSPRMILVGRKAT